MADLGGAMVAKSPEPIKAEVIAPMPGQLD
jgi:hypothetical protein